MTSQSGHFEDDEKGLEKRTLQGWVQHDVSKSFSNAVEQEVFDPLKNFANDIEWLASGGKSKPASHSAEKKVDEPADFVGTATDFGVHGTVSALTYSIAGYVTQAASRKLGAAFKIGGTAMKLLDNRFTGQVVGAGIHDFYLNADDMKGRVANAVGGATTMAVYDGANHLLPAKCRFTKAVAQPFIGAASAASGYYATTKIDGREITDSDLLRASGEGAAFGTVFPLVQFGLGKFGSRFHAGRSGSVGEGRAHSSGVEAGHNAKTEVKVPLLQAKIEKSFFLSLDGTAKKGAEGTFTVRGNKSLKGRIGAILKGEFEGSKPEPKGLELKEVKETETRKTDPKKVEVKDTEAKKAEAKEVEVKDTETKKAEVKEVEVKDTETKKAEVKEVEVKETETKKAEAKEVEVKVTETKKAEAKEVEVKETETKKAEAKEVEVKDTEAKRAEVKEVEVKETETKKAETKEVEVSAPGTKEVEVRVVGLGEVVSSAGEVGQTAADVGVSSEPVTTQPVIAEIADAAISVPAESIADVVSVDSATAKTVTSVNVTPQVVNQTNNVFTASDSSVPSINPFSAENIAAFESEFGAKSEPKFEAQLQSKYGFLSPEAGVHGRFFSYALPFTAAGGSIVAAHSAAQNTANNEERVTAANDVDLASLLQLSPEEVREYEKFRRQLPDWMDELGFRVGLYSPPSQAVDALMSPVQQAFRKARFAPPDQTTTKFTRIVAPSFSQALRSAEMGHSIRGPHKGISAVLGPLDATTFAQYEEVLGSIPELYSGSKQWMTGNPTLSREVMFKRYPFLSQDSRRQSAMSYSAENSETAGVGMLSSGGSASGPAIPDPSILSAAASQATIPAPKQ